MIEPLYDIDNLHKAFKQVKKVSGWKEQTQRYDNQLIKHLSELRERLMNGTYKPGKPNVFTLSERGKKRLIESYTIDDRVVQGCFVSEVLLPLCRNYLIYDNAASLKGRGTEFFRRRFEKHLKDYLKTHDSGYILLGDFKKYFDNIWHEQFISVLQDFGADEETIQFTRLLLKQHEIDVSYMTDDEYAHCMEVPFNALEYNNIDKSLLTGKKMMRKSMGIGSQIAQIAGVIAPYRIDNYCKIVKGIKAYGRYMDDFYIIHENKAFLHEMVDAIEEMGESQGIILNKKKTQIVNLKHSFTLLKTKYVIESGKILHFADSKTFKRERRRLKKFKAKVEAGEMTEKKAKESYDSWRGEIVRRFGEKRVEHMDKLFNDYFKGENDGKRNGRTNGARKA